MHNQLEGPATRKSNGAEVTHIVGREAADLARLREGDNGGIDESQAEICEAPVHLHFHRACELCVGSASSLSGLLGEPGG